MRTTKRPTRAKLTARQRLELMNGLDAMRMIGVEGGWDERSQFDSREAKAGAWSAHRADILRVYRDRPYRPAGWWHFDMGLDRYPEREAQEDILRELGEIA